MTDLAAMKDKIAKLLAKAERTDNEHERETFTAAAEKLMLRLGIERAELESYGEVKPEEIVEVDRLFTGNYSGNMIEFTNRLARHWGHLTVLQTINHNGMKRTAFVVGHKSDVENFLMLLDSLHLQVMSELRKWQKEHRERRRYHTDMEKFNENRSFIEGFGLRVSKRLYEIRHTEEEAASPGAALVLVGKTERVNDFVNRLYPDAKPSRTGARTGSAVGYSAGGEAGNRANLGGKSLEGVKGELS